jgi:hypothetical protein
MSDPRPLDFALEEQVDRVGLTQVLGCLSNMCEEKAQHVEEMWQDKRLAGAWSKMAEILDRASDRARLILP